MLQNTSSTKNGGFMHLHNFLFIIMSLTMPVLLQSYIYEIQVLRRWDESQRRYQYFIGLSDFHDKTNEANNDQINTLKTSFSRINQQNPKIIVEDISSPGSQGRSCCGNFFVNAQGGILGGLAQVCTSCGLNDVENVEYRYCRVTSLGPIINNLQGPLETLISSTSITIGSLLEEVDALCREIDQYRDSDVVMDYYHGSCKELNQEITALKLRDHKELSVANYVARYEKDSDRLSLVKRLLTFDSTLFDVKMLHTIVHTLNKQTTICIAGGAHIGRVFEVLKKIGYEAMYGSEIQMTKEYDPAKCLGCGMISKDCCLRPTPIDVSILNRFI